MRMLLLALSLVSCSSAPPECRAIVERCHPLATGANATTTQKECDDNASATWTAGQCADNLLRCDTACPLPSGDGGM